MALGLVRVAALRMAAVPAAVVAQARVRVVARREAAAVPAQAVAQARIPGAAAAQVVVPVRVPAAARAVGDAQRFRHKPAAHSRTPTIRTTATMTPTMRTTMTTATHRTTP